MTVRTGVLKAALGLMATCLAAYIVGPPLYWHLIEAFGSTGCPPCDCDCDSLPDLLSIPQDCAKHNPDENKDAQKKLAELLSEELKQRTAEALEKQQRANKALLEAKKMASQYQKEADKCNSGMETCEEAREKSEANLLSQKQLTVLWEQRARQKGWNDGNARSQGNAQAI
ncbi:uncharacterized protein LOC127243707 isoform X2 [Andrographis paniculata]|uniref:uncharacterized protein LOC127243707 isoform X2 n=1 Tax=Andrographis paniculata TaxID=175694 RepID=UPI0021E867F2|nr:uncharacterized protein LOC127243707 isoform X2 [Andrographis paniculata]